MEPVSMTLLASWSRLHAHTPDVSRASHTTGRAVATPSLPHESHHVTPSCLFSSFSSLMWRSSIAPLTPLCPPAAPWVSLSISPTLFSFYLLSQHLTQSQKISRVNNTNLITKWSTRTLQEFHLRHSTFALTYVCALNQKRLTISQCWRIITTAHTVCEYNKASASFANIWSKQTRQEPSREFGLSRLAPWPIRKPKFPRKRHWLIFKHSIQQAWQFMI